MVFPSFPVFLHLFFTQLLMPPISTAINTSLFEDESSRLATKSLQSQISTDVLEGAMQMVSPSPETRDFASARHCGVLQVGDVRSMSLPIWQARSHPGKN